MVRKDPAAGDLIDGVDGIRRTAAAERALNEVFHFLFTSENGRLALEYLRSITIHNVGGPEISDAALRHLEGQRYLYGIIERRIVHGRERQPALADERKPEPGAAT